MQPSQNILFPSAKSNKPPKIAVMPDGYFKEGTQTPLPGTRFGVKRVSVGDAERARQEATRDAEMGDDYNFSLMVHIVASSLTLADDVTKPLLKAGDMQVRHLFTPQGVKYIYDLVEQLHAETNPLYDEIDDPGIRRLCELLKNPETWTRLGVRAPRVRRLLTYVMDYLATM